MRLQLLTKKVGGVRPAILRAKMVRRVEEYPYSSHRAYMGLEPAGIVDVDPVLRQFGARKALARERFAKHVAAGVKLGQAAQLYETKGGVLGSEEFVDSLIHRTGEFAPKGTRLSTVAELDGEALIAAVEAVCGVGRHDFCGKAKGARVVVAKEALIVSGRRLGAGATSVARLTGLDVANVSRRHDAALRKVAEDPAFGATISKVIEMYQAIDRRESSISQA